MRPLDPHQTPLLLPCVRCYHRGACAWDGTAQAEECGPLYLVRDSPGRRHLETVRPEPGVVRWQTHRCSDEAEEIRREEAGTSAARSASSGRRSGARIGAGSVGGDRNAQEDRDGE